MARKTIYEIQVTRENGDLDTLYLCLRCIEGTSDFLTVRSKKKWSDTAPCDRCN